MYALRRAITILIIVTLANVSPAVVGGIIGRHNLPSNGGMMTGKEIYDNQMTLDLIDVTARGNLVTLTDVYTDFNSLTRKVVYSEDRS